MSQSIARINLIEPARCRPSAYVQYERDNAISELLNDNVFQPVIDDVAPYAISIEIKDRRLVIEMANAKKDALPSVSVSLRSYKRIIKDYFMMVESYNNARHLGTEKVEAIDMARRAIHNEGAEMLKEHLSEKVVVDIDTARRLFTLICVLHIGQVRGPRIS